MEMFIGKKVNHKVFGEGVIVKMTDKQSGTASHEQYVDVEFDNPVRRDSDSFVHPEVEGSVATRTFSFTSLEKFLVEEEK